MTVQDLADLELAYAPPYGSAKDAVNFAGMAAANLLAGKTDVVSPDAMPADAFLLDVREPAEFEAGAIPGATLIPLGKLRSRLAELPKDREIVVYCAVGIRGYVAERILKQRGFKVRNLNGGLVTWKLFHPPKPASPPVAQGQACSGSAPGVACTDALRRGSVSMPSTSSIPSTGPETNLQAPSTSPNQGPELLDVRGQQCPGPIVAVKQALERLPAGAMIKVLASDSGFLRDLPSFCESTGHQLLSLKETAPGAIEAVVGKAGLPQALAPSTVAAATSTPGPKRTTLVLFSNDLDRAMAGLIIANGFAALGHQVTVFFTFWGLTVLRKDNPPPVKKDLLSRMFGFMLPKGPRKLTLSKMHMLGPGTEMMKYVMRQKNVPTLAELIGQARAQGVQFLACEMAMNVMGITKAELLDGVETAGVANFAALAEKSQATLFI